MRDFLLSATTGSILSCALLLWGCDDAPDECPPDCPAMDGGGADGGGADGGDADGGDPPEDGGPPDRDAGGESCDPRALPALAVEDVAPGHSFSFPVFIAQPPGESEDLYVVEQTGFIRIVRDGAVLPTEFLDIAANVDFDSAERGLLGLAFHPDYQANGRFFVYYTPAGQHHNRVAEYARMSGDPDRADTTEVAVLLSPADPEDNHNGGMLAFGPDGYLYVGMGDGGGGGDNHGPTGNGQSTDSPFGKLHRLDVDAGGDYAAPGNPFAGGGGLATIWAYGLRNPWRFSFDRATDDLYIGDVGQYEWEEIDIQPASSAGGENYGWAAWEGTHRFEARTPLVPEPAEHVLPVFEYHHDTGPLVTGCSVTGGYVYRGAAIPELQGFYVFGDFCSGGRAAFRWCGGEVVDAQVVEDLANVPAQLTSFGEDQAGELYMTGRTGSVVRIIPG